MTSTRRAAYLDATLVGAEKGRFGAYRIGLYDRAGQRIDGYPFFATKDSFRISTPRRLPASGEYKLKGDHIYCGFLYPGYTHQFAESFVNLIAAQDVIAAHPSAKLLFHGFAAAPLTEKVFSDKPLSHVMARLGIGRERIVWAERPVTVERLILPPTAFAARGTHAATLPAAVDAYTSPIAPGPDRRVFYSRRSWKLRVKARLTNEAELEARFAEAGFRIVAPEDLTIDAQISLAKGALEIAGGQGSALHWSLFSPNCTRVISLGRRSRLQWSICRIRGQTCIDVPGKRVDLKKRRRRIPLADVERLL